MRRTAVEGGQSRFNVEAFLQKNLPHHIPLCPPSHKAAKQASLCGDASTKHHLKINPLASLYLHLHKQLYPRPMKKEKVALAGSPFSYSFQRIVKTCHDVSSLQPSPICCKSCKGQLQLCGRLHSRDQRSSS